MPLDSVVVHSVDRLEQFRDLLMFKHEELEGIYNTLSAACREQEENWNDPQYDRLKAAIDEYYQASKTHLTQLEDSGAYITSLISKLRNI